MKNNTQKITRQNIFHKQYAGIKGDRTSWLHDPKREGEFFSLLKE